MAIIVRTSEITSLKRCPQRWWWGWVEGWKPNKTDTKLWFGGGIHIALADHYRAGFERAENLKKTWLKFVRNEEIYLRDQKAQYEEGEWISARNLGFSMLDNYVYTYGDDPSWNVIATEQPFLVKILMPEAPDGFIMYAGTFDGVYRDMEENGALRLMEHKTSSGAPNFGYLELADQPNGYYMVAEATLRHQGLIGDDEHIDGIMYNYLRKSTPDDRPRNAQGKALNKDGSVSKRQDTQRLWRHPVWRSIEQRMKMKESIKNVVALMMKYRSGELKITKTPTQDCSWDCAFFAMCQLHETDADWQEYRDAMYHKIDPYSDHRMTMKSAGDDVA